MRHEDLTKSTSDNIAVCDMAPQRKHSIEFTWAMSGQGTKEALMEKVKSELQGMTVISENLSIRKKDGSWIYEARVNSNGLGLPGSRGNNQNPLLNTINSNFSGVKFVGINKQNEIEFVKWVKGKLKHVKPKLEGKIAEADEVYQLW